MRLAFHFINKILIRKVETKMVVNSIKNRLRLEDPEIEIAENVVIKVCKDTEGIILAGEYAEENMQFSEEDKFSKEKLDELYGHINQVCAILVPYEEEYKKLMEVMNRLILEDRILLMNSLISTAKFEDCEEAEKANDGR
jgi:hypothetical protein